MGTLNQDPSGGDTYPVANLATPKASADGIESGQGESKPLSEKAPPKVMTSPASQYVGNDGSGDAHLVAGNKESSSSSWAIPGVALFSPSDQSSGDTHPAAAFATPNTYPVANLATPKATADGVASGPGESKPFSEKDAPDVMATPTSQYVENESSGDAHPVASETSIEPQLEECIEEIIEIAQADNGALLEGDSPHCTQYEATEVSMAAQDLLATLYSGMGGLAPRSEREVLQAMSTPIQRRQEYVNAIAASRGVSQPAEERYVYTHKEWLDWYAEHPLSQADMDAQVWQWTKISL